MSRWVAALRFIGIGWFIGCCILLGILGGAWLDSHLNTKPILVIVGLLLGLIFAFAGMSRMLLPLISNKDKKGEK